MGAFTIKLAFAGIGHLIFDWGVPIGIIIIILLVEFFATAIGTYLPFLAPLLDKFRKDLLWVAVIIAVSLAWGAKMQHDEKARCDAKGAVVQGVVDKAVKNAVAPVKPLPDGVRGDKWDNP